MALNLLGLYIISLVYYQRCCFLNTEVTVRMCPEPTVLKFQLKTLHDPSQLLLRGGTLLEVFVNSYTLTSMKTNDVKTQVCNNNEKCKACVIFHEGRNLPF